MALNAFRAERLRVALFDERYGHWQDGLMFIGLFFLSALIAKWLWG